MNTQYTSQDYPIQPVGRHVLWQRQARRRQLLGVLLIIVGGVWLGLLLTGSVGDGTSPIDWVRGSVALLENFNNPVLVLAAALGGCGMLTAYIIHRTQ